MFVQDNPGIDAINPEPIYIIYMILLLLLLQAIYNAQQKSTNFCESGVQKKSDVRKLAEIVCFKFVSGIC